MNRFLQIARERWARERQGPVPSDPEELLDLYLPPRPWVRLHMEAFDEMESVVRLRQILGLMQTPRMPRCVWEAAAISFPSHHRGINREVCRLAHVRGYRTEKAGEDFFKWAVEMGLDEDSMAGRRLDEAEIRQAQQQQAQAQAQAQAQEMT